MRPQGVSCGSLERGEDGVGDHVHLASVGGDGEVGQGLVERRADLHELGELGQRIHVVQQRPSAALAHALCLLLERGLEVDHETPLVQRGAVLRQQDGAAAGGEHDGALARHVLDDFAFALAKPGLAFAGEDVRDVDARCAPRSPRRCRETARAAGAPDVCRRRSCRSPSDRSGTRLSCAMHIAQRA